MTDCLLFRAALLSLAVLAGCGSSSEDSAQAGAPKISPVHAVFSLPEVSPDQGFPAKIKSFNGSTVVLPRAPTRILVGNASLLDTMVGLVPHTSMVALPSTAFLYSSLKDNPGEWASVPLLAKFEAEPILAAQPDLIVVHSYQVGSTLDRVIEQEIPVVAFPVVGTWKDILKEIELMARIVGQEEAGSAVVESLQRRQRALQDSSDRSSLRILPYANYGTKGSTAGAGTTAQLMIELSGMRNAATEAGLEGHPNIDYEQLLAIDPDFFLIPVRADQETTSVETILCETPLLASLRAVREKRFLRLPESLYSTASQRVLLAAEAIAEQAEKVISTETE
ncbi:MAG: iron complex transport system substrate-binding protein [Candidatus Paceibacteria bacterium]|jgi:iron complex transport system substrate-binding protein